MIHYRVLIARTVQKYVDGALYQFPIIVSTLEVVSETYLSFLEATLEK